MNYSIYISSLFLHQTIIVLQVYAWSNNPKNERTRIQDIQQHQEARRQFISHIATTAISSPFFLNIPPAVAQPSSSLSTTSTSSPHSNDKNKDNDYIIFTEGYGREEYTNSITASRDTNISPKEVYDSIQSSYISYPIEQLQKRNGTAATRRTPRAFDVGAGAGVSTNTLYLMGYENIEAVDWSSKAWDENVNDELVPKGVNFYAMDDESYILERKRKNQQSRSDDDDDELLFDVIVFNFAVNDSKARSYAMTMLQPDGRLLAPVNTQTDYWLKQKFVVYDSKGNVLWSARDVGAWSVQFQPDVTQDTCQGIWCAPYNGFKKKIK